MKGRYTLCLNYGKPETGHRHYGMATPGANCEYNVFAPKALHKIPDNLSFIHAALLDTAGVSLHGIEMIGVTPGGTAAVWGPGPIGLCSMQMIKGMGAKTVIMVGRRHRLKVAGEIGADILIDYEKEDPVKRILEITDGIGVDEIQECCGANVALEQCVASIRKGGKINSVAFYKDSEVKVPPFTPIRHERTHPHRFPSQSQRIGQGSRDVFRQHRQRREDGHPYLPLGTLSRGLGYLRQ